MNEIVKARSILTPFFSGGDRSVYELKRQAIEHSLYGVDLDSSAVDITKLRFWLSLIVDEENIEAIRPLPNLDHRIMCGNSLVDEFEGVSLFDESLLDDPGDDPEALTGPIDARIEELGEELHRVLTGAGEGDSSRIRREIARLERKKKEVLAGPRASARQVTFDQAASLRIKESRRKLRAGSQRLFFNEQNRARKNECRAAIERLEDLIEETLKEAGNTDACRKLPRTGRTGQSRSSSGNLLLGGLPAREPGVRCGDCKPTVCASESITEQKAISRSITASTRGPPICMCILSSGGGSACGRRGLHYILPNKWMRANYGKPLRAWLKEQRIDEIVDFGDLPVFESAIDLSLHPPDRGGGSRERFDAVQVATLRLPGPDGLRAGSCISGEPGRTCR